MSTEFLSTKIKHSHFVLIVNQAECSLMGVIVAFANLRAKIVTIQFPVILANFHFSWTFWILHVKFLVPMVILKMFWLENARFAIRIALLVSERMTVNATHALKVFSNSKQAALQFAQIIWQIIQITHA